MNQREQYSDKNPRIREGSSHREVTGKLTSDKPFSPKRQLFSHTSTTDIAEDNCTFVENNIGESTKVCFCYRNNGSDRLNKLFCWGMFGLFSERCDYSVSIVARIKAGQLGDRSLAGSRNMYFSS